MSNDPTVNESRALRELLNSKQEAFFQLSSQFDELSDFVNNLRTDHTRLIAENVSLQNSIVQKELKKENLQAEINRLIEEKKFLTPQVEAMNKLLTDNQDTEVKYLALCKTLEHTNQLINEADQTLIKYKQQIKEVNERREQLSERMDYYDEQIRDKKEYIKATDIKFKQAEQTDIYANQKLAEAKAIMIEVEEKKKEFLENPRSFGSYLSEIKAKTGINVLDLMHKNGIK